MSDEEEKEDYLSEKFLAGIVAQSSSGPKPYAQRRREAQRQSELRNLAGRRKSKKEIERENLEALKEGMGTSLFEREKLGEVGGPSKAMNMMAKMGFKPGQTLGKQREATSNTESGDVVSPKKGDQTISGLKAPITVNVWEGKPLMSQVVSLSYKGLSRKKGLGSHEAPALPYYCSRGCGTCHKDGEISRRLHKKGFQDESPYGIRGKAR